MQSLVGPASAKGASRCIRCSAALKLGSSLLAAETSQLHCVLGAAAIGCCI